MVVQGLADGIVTFDPRGRVVRVNRAAVRLLGLSGSVAAGEGREPDWPMVDEDGVHVVPDARPEAEAARSGAVVEGSLGAPVGDGTLRWLDISAHPIERTNERWVVASYRDVTDRRRVETELELSLAADRAKSEFLSRMSHELRTPLNVVLGYAQLLRMDELAPQHRESVEKILMAGRHLLELVEDVLDLERIETGRFEITLRRVAVGELLREVVELVQPLAAARSVTVVVRSIPDDDVYAVADERRMRQVMLNLMTNAIKYNRSRGHVTITAHELAGAIVVRVRDTGRGVAPDRLAQLFVPFERLGADALGIDGAGIGLALSKRLVEAMGGRIGVESSVGTGSTFWFVVPSAPPDGHGTTAEPVTEALSPEAAGDLVRRLQGPPRRLLYIEDNPESRTLLEQLAAHWGGFEVVTVATATLGLLMAQDVELDAVLVDLHLPDGSGEDVLRVLRADPRTADLPVIVLTADATAARRERLVGLGAVAYLTKPLDVSELFRTLDEVTPAATF